MSLEGRAHRWADFTVRDADSPDSPGTLVGYGIVFNRDSDNLGGFVERISPRAVAKTVGDQRANLRSLFNHNEDHLLGTVGDGSLRLSVDEVGVRYEVDLPDTTAGRDVAVLARSGRLRGSSFQFITRSDDWEPRDDGTALRTVTELELHELGPVTNPAYPDTATVGLAVRSLAASLDGDVDRVEQLVREGRFTDLLAPKDEGRPPVHRPRLVSARRLWDLKARGATDTATRHVATTIPSISEETTP